MNNFLKFSDFLNEKTVLPKDIEKHWKKVNNFDKWKKEVSKIRGGFIDSSGFAGKNKIGGWSDSVYIIKDRDSDKIEIGGIFYKNADYGLINSHHNFYKG